MDSFLKIRDKVLNGERISETDAVFLFETPHLYELGALADEVNLRKNKKTVFYNLNSHLNPTNICVMSCKFCGFARKPGDDGAFAYSLEEIISKAETAVRNGAKEIHMVGGLHPRWKLGYYADMFRNIKERFPSVHIKALTAVEIDWLSRKARKSHEETLLFLKEAGLDSLPGGGAEIFHPDCRELITAKLSTETWLDIHRTAHKIGMKSNCTMLYGHVETYTHRAYHLGKLRDLQDETNGFNCFIPLAFQPHNNEMGITRYTFGADDLKTIAVARIFLDNFKSVKSFWVMLGQDIAQIGLHFGANDIDGTVLDEKISLMAGGRSGIGMMQKDMKQLVLKAQRYPQERDTAYNAIGPSSTLPEGNEKSEKDASHLLNQAVEGKELDEEELLSVANHANFFFLSLVANHIRVKLNGDLAGFCSARVLDFCGRVNAVDTNIDENKTVVVDCGGLAQSHGPRIYLEQLLEVLQSLKKRGKTIGIAGFASLWNLAQHEAIPLGDLYKRLLANGVSLVVPSSQENESILTNSEIMNLHRSAHANGLKSMAKAEICSPAAGTSPLWKPFVERLMAFRDLQKNSPGILGLVIEPEQDSWVTAFEMLRATALARLAVQNVQHVCSPLSALPTTQEKPAGNFLKGQEKYAPLALLGGADDWGFVPIDCLKDIEEEVSSIRRLCRQRDLHFQTLVIKSQGKQAGDRPHAAYS